MRKKIGVPDKTTSVKLSLTALTSGAVWFYTGPFAAVAARESFTFIYDLLYGIPLWYNPSYALTYMPIREHIANYAFEYGGLMLGSLCAPFIYKGVNTISNMGGKMLAKLGIVTPEKKFFIGPIQEIPPLRFSKVKNRTNFFLEGSKDEKEEDRKEKRNSKNMNTLLLSRSDKHKSKDMNELLAKEPQNSKNIESILRKERRSSKDFEHFITSAPTRLNTQSFV